MPRKCYIRARPRTRGGKGANKNYKRRLQNYDQDDLDKALHTYAREFMTPHTTHTYYVTIFYISYKHN